MERRWRGALPHTPLRSAGGRLHNPQDAEDMAEPCVAAACEVLCGAGSPDNGNQAHPRRRPVTKTVTSPTTVAPPTVAAATSRPW